MTQEEPIQRGARLEPNLERLVRRPGDQTILVVEDNWMLSDTSQEVLREAGFRTVAAPNVEEALKEFERVSPDAAFLDLSLPYGPGSHSDKPEGIEAGLEMIEEFRTRDPTFCYAVYSGRGSWEIAQILTNRDEQTSSAAAFLTKGATGAEDMARAARKAVTATAERRESLLGRFSYLYSSTYDLDSKLRDGTCVEVEDDLGEVLRIFHDRIPFSTNQGFYMDSLSGVVQLRPLDPTLKYAPQEKAFVLKRMTPVEFEAFIESSSAANEGLPLDERLHAQAIASYGYEGSIYALIPQLFGPNFAYVYDLLDEETRRIEEIRIEGKKLVPEVMKLAAVGANVSQLSKWHKRISPRLSRETEESAADARRYYAATAEECVEYLMDGSLDARLSKLLKLRSSTEGEPLSKQEKDGILQAYDGFKDLRLDAPGSVARLMDAKPQNSGVRLGIPQPTYQEVFDFLMPEEHQPGGIAPLSEIPLSEAGIEKLRHRIQEPLEKHFLIYETHHREGAVLEDLAFALSNPDARLDTWEKIRHLLYFVEGYYEERHRAQALADYGLVGLPKAQRMQFLQFNTFQRKNDERHDRLVIGDEEFREATLKYARNATHWGNEFIWSAAFTHHVTSQITEGINYQSLKTSLIRLNMDEHLGRLLQTRPFPPGSSSSLPNRMHTLALIGSKYFVPGPEMRQYLAETA